MSTLPVGVTAFRGHWNERSEFSISTMPVAELSPVSSEVSIIPHYAFGQGWRMRIVLINPTDEPLQGSLELDSSTALSYTIAPRSEKTLHFSEGIPDLKTGSARIIPAEGSATPSAAAMFSYRPNGVTLTEASITASLAAPAFQVDVERNGTATRTGVAVVNASDASTTVSFDLSDAGSAAGWHLTRTFGPRERISLYLEEIAGFDQLPESFRGILRITSAANSPVAVAGLRTRYNERGDLLLTTTMALDERTTNPNSEFVVPQFAAGSGYSSEFLIFGQSPSIQLFDEFGQSLAF